MKITFLSDNRTSDDSLITEHGLSVYVETDTHKVLLDTGASDIFLRNAKTLGVDLKEVDYVVISHGHSDHIGGLPYFLKINDKAKIIMSPAICGGYYVSKRNHEHSITTDIDFESFRDRIIFADRNFNIDNEISVIAEIPYIESMPEGNCNLYCKDDKGNLVRDDFKHEIACRIGDLLFTGCAHHGIINILKASDVVPCIVIGGFHLLDDYETDSNLNHITHILSSQYPDTVFYTGHCTGNRCIEYLKDKMPDKIDNFCLGYHIPDIKVEKLHSVDSSSADTIKRLVRQLSLTAELPSEDYLKEITSSENNDIFVLKYDEEIIGMAVLCRCLMPTGTKYWIEDVTIDVKYRGRHLGKRLVNTILCTLPHNSKVMLTSRPSRINANNMYKKLGFEIRKTNVYKKEVK